jgi:hypothetical protein
MAKELLGSEAADLEQHEVAQPLARGPGVAALQSLLSKGIPSVKDVIDLVDQYRGEHDAMFKILQSSLGNTYVQKTVEAMGELRLSIPRQELAAGDPGKPDAGFFLLSGKDKAATWGTAGGGFTGRVDEKGLDSTVKLSADDALRAKYAIAEKEGSLAWQRDGKTLLEAYGKEGEFGLRRTFETSEDSSIEAKLRHRTTETGGVTEATADYKDPKTTAGAHLGVRSEDGGVVAGIEGRHELSPDSEISGSASYSPETWSVEGKGKTKLGEHGALEGEARLTPEGLTASALGSYKDDKTTASVAGQLTAGGALSGQAEINHDFEEGRSVHATAALGGTSGLSVTAGGEYRIDDTTSLTGDARIDADGWKVGGTATRDLGGGSSATLTGEVGSQGYRIGLDGKYVFSPETTATGSFLRTQDSTSASLGVQHKSGPFSLDSSLSYLQTDGAAGQTQLKLTESYKSETILQTFELDAGVGARDYLTASGSLEAQVGRGLYMGTWGSVGIESGKQTTSTLGVSLTFTPSERSALTLAGIMNQSGQFEARLQFDVFKDRVNGIGELSAAKKDALFSLFLSVSQGSSGMLDGRFGASKYSMPLGDGTAPQATLGVRFNF